MKDLRSDLLEAFREHARGHIEKHRMNVEVLVNNPVGTGENSDIIEQIEQEMREIADYHDLLEVSEKYF